VERRSRDKAARKKGKTQAKQAPEERGEKHKTRSGRKNKKEDGREKETRGAHG